MPIRSKLRPYLIEAYYRCIIEEGLIPMILVDGKHRWVSYPKRAERDDGLHRICLQSNEVDDVTFVGRANLEFDLYHLGERKRCSIPMAAIKAVYPSSDPTEGYFIDLPNPSTTEHEVVPVDKPFRDRRYAMNQNMRPTAEWVDAVTEAILTEYTRDQDRQALPTEATLRQRSLVRSLCKDAIGLTVLPDPANDETVNRYHVTIRANYQLAVTIMIEPENAYTFTTAITLLVDPEQIKTKVKSSTNRPLLESLAYGDVDRPAGLHIRWVS